MSSWLDRFSIYALTHHDSVAATFQMAEDVIRRGVPGDMVECGVYAGAQCAVMAKAIMLSGGGRRVHLFDSFEGMPQCGREDLEFIRCNKKPREAAYSIEGVKRNMYDWQIPDDMLVYHHGWFSDTVPKCETGPISLLRLDGDLYESTQVCMKYLYPRVSMGGWIIVDDYHLSGCEKAIREVVEPHPIYFQRLP